MTPQAAAFDPSPAPATQAPDVPTTQAPDAPPIPGYTGMWVGISLEFLEFAVFFVVYFTARLHYPQEFREGSQRLWTSGGLMITLAMVTSGWLLTRSIAAMRSERRRRAGAWLCAALLVALAYPVLKVQEIGWNQAHGIAAGTGIFAPVYYYLTINHMIHASWGILGMAWTAVRLFSGAYTARDHRGLEAMATYWHATDIVWLMLFALLYAFA